MSDKATPKTIVLMSSDGVAFEVEAAVALKSETIKNLLEDDIAGIPLPLPNINSNILAKVIEYCKYHTDAAAKAAEQDAAREFDTAFVKVEQSTLFDLIMAADFLNIKSLVDLMCQAVADMIKGKTPEEIRTTFGITNEFTREEEDEIRRENAWAYE